MIEKNGIQYSLPAITLLHVTPLVNAEIAGRTAYDSFSASEHQQVRNFSGQPVADIEHSDLMDQLCHVYFHDSVAEHINLTFHISGISRGVLQEEARHRIQSLTVRSTRYTMSDVINAFVASLRIPNGKDWFINKCISFNMLVTLESEYQAIEWSSTYDKFLFQMIKNGVQEFYNIAVAKSSLPFLTQNLTPDELFETLQAGKKKRNVGDAFKHIVTDNWKVDLVVTFNLRSLKNFFQLRDSGAAYFLIQELAKEMKKVTPLKYLKLIDKNAS